MPNLFAYEAAFDSDSLAQIKAFDNWQPILEQELVKAHEKSDAVLQATAIDYMHWQNSSGKLEGSFEAFVDSPYQSQMGTDIIYGRRREEGFSGMTDRIGRFYPSDPGAYFMQNAVNRRANDVEKIFGTALDAALSRLGVMNGGNK